jgi:hypothetical protein
MVQRIYGFRPQVHLNAFLVDEELLAGADVQDVLVVLADIQCLSPLSGTTKSCAVAVSLRRFRWISWYVVRIVELEVGAYSRVLNRCARRNRFAP